VTQTSTGRKIKKSPSRRYLEFSPLTQSPYYDRERPLASLRARILRIQVGRGLKESDDRNQKRRRHTGPNSLQIRRMNYYEMLKRKEERDDRGGRELGSVSI